MAHLQDREPSNRGFRERRRDSREWARGLERLCIAYPGSLADLHSGSPRNEREGDRESRDFEIRDVPKKSAGPRLRRKNVDGGPLVDPYDDDADDEYGAPRPGNGSPKGLPADAAPAPGNGAPAGASPQGRTGRRDEVYLDLKMKFESYLHGTGILTRWCHGSLRLILWEQDQH
ncbi:hypothetical protein SISNIDRAFT_463588 [Sistotremastrum niveocremeum HHB9708]|uniref:Uncharacterized protein n=1 Tax=Sistotremastrum niveocremeum HHB9708 TaxID=1314777 RepID=A0A164YEN1_9AGAM|nr:hypothetical protein SISNIDRAFT_463588 [Sistotremastrum niveocremeum HHB9708]